MLFSKPLDTNQRRGAESVTPSDEVTLNGKPHNEKQMAGSFQYIRCALFLREREGGGEQQSNISFISWNESALS